MVTAAGFPTASFEEVLASDDGKEHGNYISYYVIFYHIILDMLYQTIFSAIAYFMWHRHQQMI